MLLNELQRQQARIEQLERQIEELKTAVSTHGR
jgi:type II secretory pathway component PulJ